MPAAVILAGGRSTRFGEADKAVAPLAGVPMIRRVADRLVDEISELVVNCRSDQTDAIREAMAGYPHPVTYAEDEEPDEGPMAGIKTGLRAVKAEYAVVVACDMPFVDADLVSYLFERAAGHAAAVPKLDDGWYQTTHAVYRAQTMADACDTSLLAGNHKILDPLFELDYVIVDDEAIRGHGSTESFANCNTREEFEAAAARF
ncbi:molybdenum cofactor guanylyltransferase [Haladaptatus sp. DJG-WS-42]|uniref:molybdenum cofactor guanylyltransferase n=1 Tax=Haladaptatus sp. DJG-WS-42 TaxID=3120516 RepID=UPI0030D4BFAE